MRVLVPLLCLFLVACLAPPARATERVLFGGIEGRGSSLGVTMGFKIAAPPTPDGPGLVVMALADVGASLARAPPAEGGFWYAPHGAIAASLLAGGQWAVPGGVFTAAIGPGVARRQQAEPTGVPRWLATRYGPVALAELWTHPREDLLVAGTLVASGAGESLWARAAFGTRAIGEAFVGPEATFYTDATYRELRLGLHLTGVKVGDLSLRLSGGVAFHERRRSPYLALVIDRSM